MKIWQFHYCRCLATCVLTRLVTTWMQLNTVMTRLCNSWLMDTSLCPAELITAENAQQAAALFSYVNFVISACLTIPDQYSIKEFLCLQLICCSSVRKPRRRAVVCLPSSKKGKRQKTGLWQEIREDRSTGALRGHFSVTMYNTVSLKRSGMLQ